MRSTGPYRNPPGVAASECRRWWRADVRQDVYKRQDKMKSPPVPSHQIVDYLRDRLNELKSGRDDDIQVETHLRYFENLKMCIRDRY